MKNLKYQVVSLVLVAVAFVSCSDDDSTLDTQKPTITVQSPTTNQEVEPGTQLNIKAMLQDETALASYKIEIHSAEDGHEHKAFGAKEAEDFHYEETFQVAGNSKNYQVDYNINVPVGVAEEHYHVGIFCIDAAGNQSQQFVEIFIGEEHTH